MSKNLLSIIVPTLNEEKYLPILLSSLENQTIKNFEVIIVDGNSKDATKTKVLGFESKLDIKFFENNKGNPAGQRNFGAEKATTDYLFFLDADYKVPQNFVEEVSKTIQKTNADVIIPHSSPYTKKIFWKMYYKFANLWAYPLYVLRIPFAVGPPLCIKKEAFGKIGGYDETIFVYEDQEIVRQSFRNKFKIVYAKNIKVFFSDRREVKEGILRFLLKNAFASLHVIFLGPVRKKIYKYDMGGQEYKK